MIRDNVIIDKALDKSKFIELWLRDIIESIKRINPNIKKEDIKKVALKLAKKNMRIPEVKLDNSYTKEERESNLLSVLEWILDSKPIISGNATFYKNQIDLKSLTSDMLMHLIARRKSIKKEMFSLPENMVMRYADLDRSQNNVKRLTNSWYGGATMPTSPFFNRWTGPAITGIAQSVISTAKNFFEMFIVDNYKFIDINECFHYMNFVLEDTLDELDDFIIVPSREEVFERIKNMFLDDVYEDKYEKMIYDFIYNLNSNELVRLFYANNLEEFTVRHFRIKSIIYNILDNTSNIEYSEKEEDIPEKFHKLFPVGIKDRVKKYNKHVDYLAFLNPNEPPEEIIDYLKELDEFYRKYVFIKYMSIDRIHRLKYFTRRCVAGVDTDSCIMSVDLWVNMIRKNIMNGYDFNRNDGHNRFIMVNIMAFIITSTIETILLEYGKYSNIPEEYRKYFAMKNEFYFDFFAIGKKKNYLSSVRLREGNLFAKYKLDIKGFSFNKSTTSELSSLRFEKIIRERILDLGYPDIKGIIKDLFDFEQDIEKDLRNGDVTYLPMETCKDFSAYKDPYSRQGVRGAIAWNFLYPDKKIEYPARVSILKLNTFIEEDIEPMKDKYPREYNILKEKIFNSPVKELQKKGLQILSVPDGEKIPEWAKDYIDYDTIKNNIIAQFKGLTDMFDINFADMGKVVNNVDRKSKKISNIIRF